MSKDTFLMSDLGNLPRFFEVLAAFESLGRSSSPDASSPSSHRAPDAPRAHPAVAFILCIALVSLQTDSYGPRLGPTTELHEPPKP